MRKTLFPLALVATLALPLAGCDLFGGGDDDLIGRPSNAEIDDVVDAIEADLDERDVTCDVEVEAIGEGDVSGQITGSDCELAEGVGADFYAFEVLESTSVQIDMESDDFADLDPFLHLLDEDAEELQSNDDVDFNDEDFDAQITRSLSPGVYIVVARSAGSNIEAGEGDYQLTIDAEGEDDED